jgi:uncharacterized protein YdhG (YjbR/CyaY superfamily)
MSPKKAAQTSASRSTGRGSQLLTAEERAAMKETLDERRRAGLGKADGESDVLAKIAEMPKPDRAIAERLHAIIKASAPTLAARTWYGMPAYARDGKVVCFFQSGQKFKSRYATFGFQPAANLDDGYLANLLCPQAAHPRRREKDRQARQESGELRKTVANSARCAKEGSSARRDDSRPAISGTNRQECLTPR